MDVGRIRDTDDVGGIDSLEDDDESDFEGTAIPVGGIKETRKDKARSEIAKKAKLENGRLHVART